MITAQQVVNEARTWIGVPFQHQGRTRNGVDCLGLVICVRQSLGPFPEASSQPSNYRRQVRDGLMLERITQNCEPSETAEPASVILMKWPRMPHPTHVAICTGDNIIHSYSRQGRVLEVGYRSQWMRWTHSIWRLPGVSYA